MPAEHKSVCPICQTCVRDLPRHTRQVHKWNNVLKFRRKHENEKKEKDYRYYNKYSIETCPAIIKRVGQHLEQIHKIPKNSAVFLRYIAEVVQIEIKKYIRPSDNDGTDSLMEFEESSRDMMHHSS